MGLQIYGKAKEFQLACEQLRYDGNTLSVVPTMGALHAGHAALMQSAKSITSHVAATIFVNPTQFGPNEDFTRYPRTFEKDCETCEKAGVSLLFAPSTREMYPDGESTRVVVSRLTEGLCGASRPGHFEGVTTIVTKLLVLAGTCTAVFGKKDYQQLKVIERLVKDLLLPTHVVAHPIVREPDGLALSSRNAYLSAAERAQALGIVRGLSRAWQAFQSGLRGSNEIGQIAARELDSHGLAAQYVSVLNADTLEPFADGVVPTRALLAVAVMCGRTRLIDNVVLGEDPDPLQAVK